MRARIAVHGSACMHNAWGLTGRMPLAHAMHAGPEGEKDGPGMARGPSECAWDGLHLNLTRDWTRAFERGAVPFLRLLSFLTLRSQSYYTLYKEHIPVAQLVRETAAVMQEFTRECLAP